ncbi:XRE family transcriptional regulator [Fluviicola sp.]|uniref:helix-turn-helix domain-containing protein n=1 Tax=Fluviicola sp. TaxID=1917219 RepID=UPI0026199157|nr:XRE family transcriptional regulator [Fluviicola sp.]
MSNSILPQFGRKIRTIRIEKKLSIQEVADRSEISKGMLSKIENGRSIPSLQVLLSVIKGLGVDIQAFFTGIYLDNDKKYIHVKKQDVTIIEKEQGTKGYTYSMAFGSNIGSETIEVVILTIDPGAIRDKVTTDAYELKYMISGKVKYYLEDDFIELEKGDFLFYNGRIPHVPINEGNEQVEMLVVYFFHSTDN